MKAHYKKLAAVIGLITLGGLGIGAAAQQDDVSNFQLDNTLLDVMDAVVMEAADVLWQAGSVVSYMDDAGNIQTLDYSPQTDEDWHKYEHGAILLAEATNMMLIPGRPIAPPEMYGQDPGPGELSQEEIEVLIADNWATWTGFANALHLTALEALDLAQKRDLDGLMELGATIDEVCESCHQVFWYPEN